MSYILGFNVDHICTLRNARQEGYPNLIDLAKLSIQAGAQQITAHLREDRRHIKDEDIQQLKELLSVPLNMEMAITEEMLSIALKVKPYYTCLVPEKRNEVTTEGGLLINKENLNFIKEKVKQLQEGDINVTLFVDPDTEIIDHILHIAPNAVEINTGVYSNNYHTPNKENEVNKIIEFCNLFSNTDIKVHAGHGLNFDNIYDIAKIKNIVEFNIGHFLVSYALTAGIENSIKTMISHINKARA